MRCQRSAPEATQASGDDEILLGLRQRTERCPWLAALKQHGTEIIVSVEKPHGWITVYERQRAQILAISTSNARRYGHSRRNIRS